MPRRIPANANPAVQERKILERNLKKWERRLQPLVDQEESTRITSDDLKIRIGPAPLTPEIRLGLSHKAASRSQSSRRRTARRKKPSP